MIDEDQATFEASIKLSDAYNNKITAFLNTGNKMNLKPGEYMQTYSAILKVCDELDRAA